MASRTGTFRAAVAVLVSLLTVVVSAACSGSSSSSGSGAAQALLVKTFSGNHTVKSGVLDFSLALSPSNSSSETGPISVSLSGPFESSGHGKLPESDLNIGLDALGHHGQLGIISTGGSGYVTLDGTAYKLPSSDVQKIASSFSSASSGGGALSKLGINPLHWVNDPTIVGTETIGGAQTTHIRAGIDVAALLGDLNTFLGKASSSTKVIPGTISAAKRQKIAAEIKNPTVDVWTGTTDNTLRKLSLDLSFPVSGEISALLGGTTTAALRDDPSVRGPQPAADDPGAGQPTIVQRLRDKAARDRSAARRRGTGQSVRSARSGRAQARAHRRRPRNTAKYARCLKRAGGDVSKMQKCASLINSRPG